MWQDVEGTHRGNILCDLDRKVKVKVKEADIWDGVPSTAALVYFWFKSWTLKASITTAADEKFCDIFPNFQ